MCKSNSLLHLGGNVALGRAHRGEGEHGHLRVLAGHKGAPRLGRGDSNLGELVGSGVDIQAAVGKQERALCAVLGGLGAHDKEGRNKLSARCGLKDLKSRTQGVCGGVAGARDQTVGVAHLNHHGAKVGGIVHLLTSLLDGHTLLGAQLGKLGCISLVLLGSLGVNNGDTRNVNLCRIAKNNEVGKVFSYDFLGSFDGTGVFALGKDDGLLVRLGGSLHAV